MPKTNNLNDDIVLTLEEWSVVLNRINALERRCTDLESSVGSCQIHLEQIEEAEHAADDTQPDFHLPYDPSTDRYLVAAKEWGCSRKEAKNRILQAEHGPEFSDGTDAEGFRGGDERMGVNPSVLPARQPNPEVAMRVLNNLEKHARLPHQSRGWHPDDDGRA